jgi:hypothetical protein
MPSDPGQPPSPERPQTERPQSVGAGDRAGAASGGQDGVELEGEERSGPLTITRVSKDDGRALILYGHDEAQAGLAQAELEDAAAREPERGDGPS